MNKLIGKSRLHIASWLVALALGGGCSDNTNESMTLPPDIIPPDGDPCSLAPCQNGGVCHYDGATASCECPSGFTGQFCEQNINDCPANACENGGTCVDGVNSYSCACPAGTAGEHCEIDLDLRVTMPRRMVSDKSLTLRAEMLDPATGKIVTDGCFDTLGSVTIKRADDGSDVPLTVTVFDDHLPVPDDSIRFYHGVGSVSLTLDGGAAVPAGEYLVTVTVGDRTATRHLTVESNPIWRVMPANLSGADLTWGPNENIRLSQHNTTVPAGSTLTILPGTMIMVDTTGKIEDGTLLTVNGKITATGTFDQPIHFFSERGAQAMTHVISGSSLSNPNAWRGIFLYGADSSNLDWVILTGAGNGTVVSHPRPPIINIAGTHNLAVSDSIFTDATGMVFQSPSTGTHSIRRSLVSRVGIGAEFLSSGNKVDIEDSWWTSIGRGPTSPLRYDGDGIHVDGAASRQTIRRCYVVDIGDDAIDHSNSTFTIEDTVIHDAGDKAVSMTNGSATVRNSLIYRTGSGVRGTAKVYNSTILSPSPIANPLVLSDSIIWPNTLSSCSGTFTNNILGTGSDLSCGTGNISVDPMFNNAAMCDYSLAVNSPALTASSTGGVLGYVKK